jgi:hypothetical protein
MTENSLAGLSDSLCEDIAKYHLANNLYSVIELGGSGTTISTMLGRSVSTGVDSVGNVVLNSSATITSDDNEVTNGIVQVINRVVPKSTRYLPDELGRHEEYSIFYQALRATGLDDSLRIANKGKTYTLSDYYDTDKSTALYYPKTCKVGFTIFAETDSIMKANGINNLNDLISYANKVYGDATSWYDYMKEKGYAVSTGTDYKSRNNALNMFVAYHILYAAMAQDQMVFEDKAGVSASVDFYNYVNDGEPYDYYETMLPHTIMKIWEPNQKKNLYINRYQTYNTLTNEVGTKGSNHTLIYAGVPIVRKDISSLNGYIHPINDMLVYNANVPKGVLHERLRFDSSTFLKELINNGFRYMTGSEMSTLNDGGSGTRMAFPTSYFDGIKSLVGDNTLLRYNMKGVWWSSEADIFQGWGKYDFCIKLPPIPSGTYELRIIFAAMDHGTMQQFYYGTKPSAQSMTALNIPLDVRTSTSDPSIGWTAFYNEEDRGVESDKGLRNRGYMRGPYSFTGHPDLGYDPLTTGSCRGSSQSIRRVLGTVTVKQSEDFWLRLKNCLQDNTLKWQIDFIEFVPVDVVNNDQYVEDWY